MKYFFCWEIIALQDPIILGLKHLPCTVQMCEDLMIFQLAVACLGAADKKLKVSDSRYYCSQNRHVAMKMSDAVPTAYRVQLSLQPYGGKYKYNFLRDVTSCILVNVSRVLRRK
jgi:hypothetical protein